MNIHEMLNSLEAAEEAFLQTEFLAPVLPGGQVLVRIAGVICTLCVTGEVEPGWAILKPLDHVRAVVVEEPSLKQVRDYLALFPAVRLLLVARPLTMDRMSTEAQTWLAIAAERGDRRVQIRGPVRVHLVSGVQPFQPVVARFDGALFWFEEVDRRRNPAIAARLRRALDDVIKPKDLCDGRLTEGERQAYKLAYKASEAARRNKVEARLSRALAHAGAELASFIEREDAYTVAFTVDGRPYRSTVRQQDLTVLSSGISLRGRDSDFDLESLVGVLRQSSRLRARRQTGPILVVAT